MKRSKATIGIWAFGLVLAITAVAFAHGGYGRHMGDYGGHMMGPGYGGRHMMDYGPGAGRGMRGSGGWGTLSEEDTAKIYTVTDEFYKETRELREKISDARIALGKEMNNDQPDESKVVELQKQVSKLEAEFDQKSVAHQLKVNKLIPEKSQSRGFRGGYCW